MSYTTATFSDVTYLDQQLLPRRQLRPVLRGAIVIGVGTMAAAGVIGAMAAASMMFGHPHAAIATYAPTTYAPTWPAPANNVAAARQVPAPFATAASPQRSQDMNWAELISNPKPFSTPSHFTLPPAVAAATPVEPPAPVASAPDTAPPAVMARAEIAPPGASPLVTVPMPPVISRADDVPEPPVANLPELAPMPPVIARREIAPEPSDANAREAAPLPPVMVHSEPVPLPPRRPTEIASREPVARPEAIAKPEAISLPLARPDREAARPAPVPAKPRTTDVARTAPAAVPGQEDDRYPLQKFFSALTGSLRPSSGSAPAVGNGTALYDIAAHTVYLPNGERLEAHSGLGGNFDNPRSISEKNRGVTPPNVYQLSLRAQPFHGVAALRLTPTNEGAMYGRVGMLAHTYMLGPRGDSNGCVSFRDYQKFLHAYQSGQISRLVVVTHAGAAPYSVASNGR